MPLHRWDRGDHCGRSRRGSWRYSSDFKYQHMAVFGVLNYMDFAGHEFAHSSAMTEPGDLSNPWAVLSVPFPVAGATGIQLPLPERFSQEVPAGAVWCGPERRRAEQLYTNRIAQLARLGNAACSTRRPWNAWVAALMNEKPPVRCAELGGIGPRQR